MPVSEKNNGESPKSNVFLVSIEGKAKFYTNKFNFKKFTVFTETLVAVRIGHKSILWNKATYIGAAILDLSKIELYKYNFETILPKYGSNARVMYKDTDYIV